MPSSKGKSNASIDTVTKKGKNILRKLTTKTHLKAVNEGAALIQDLLADWIMYNS